MSTGLPVLYSFRRCPYAIRARMALHYSGTQVELREVVLKDKPTAMLQASPKATVPVLVLPDGRVHDESREIIRWALDRHDPDHWLPAAADVAAVEALLDANDGPFKDALDRYKYAVRFPEQPAEHYRAQGEAFLARLEEMLGEPAMLAGERPGLADVAIFPFVRQFAFVDRDWFDATGYVRVRHWLDDWLASDLFTGVMRKYPQWHEGDAATVFP